MNHKSTHEWGRHKAAERYADGGNIEPIRFGVDKTGDALQRLKAAGMLNHGQATDYAASQLAREGYDPVKLLGTPAKYGCGGKV